MELEELEGDGTRLWAGQREYVKSGMKVGGEVGKQSWS